MIHKVKLICPSRLAEGPAYYPRKPVHAVRTVKTLRTDAVQIPAGYFSHSPTIHRQLWNTVIRLPLTYQQDVMEWSYVPAYLDSLCFLEWRVSWPAQTEPKHEDMALRTIFQLNVYTLWLKYLSLWLSFKFMGKILWCYHSKKRLADVTTAIQMLNESSIVYIPLLDFPSLLHQVKQHHLRRW